MKEYQQSIWDGIRVVEVKKKMVNPPTPPNEPPPNVLEWIKSARITINGRIQCEKCRKSSDAQFLVRVMFSQSREPIRYYMCEFHTSAFLDAFAPFVERQ